MQIEVIVNLLNKSLRLPTRAPTFHFDGLAGGMGISRNVPANLERLLRDRGLSWKDFAARVGVSAATASHWKKGKSLPETWRLDDIARVLKTDLIELVRDPEVPLEHELTVGFLREMAHRLGHDIKKKS